MIDTLASKMAFSFVAPWSERLQRSGLSEKKLLLASFLFGLVSCFCVSLHSYIPALVFLLLNRFFDTLADSLQSADTTSFMKNVFDDVFFASFIFFFMLGQNGTGIAAAFLLLSFLVAKNCSKEADNFIPILENVEIVVFMAVCCLLPQTYALFSILLGFLFWVDAGRGFFKSL